MKYTSFKETNKVLENSIPVCVAAHQDNLACPPALIAKVKLTKQEIETISKKGFIWLGLMGPDMPIIWASSNHPFKEMGFIPVQVNF